MHLRFFFLLSLFFALPAGALSDAEETRARDALVFLEKRDCQNAQAHARQAGSLGFSALIEWQCLLDPDSGATFQDIARFLAEHPDWPGKKRLRVRAEFALMNSGLSGEEILRWFDGKEPLTGAGRLALAEALAAGPSPSPERIERLIKDAWILGDFDASQEKNILGEHGGLIRDGDDEARADRLLWEEKTAAAERMLPRLDVKRRSLARARLALIQNKRNVSSLVKQVDPSVRNDPGLIYDRMRWRAKKGDEAGARELLLAAPESVPYPDKWWRWRERQVREMLDEKNYALAERLMKNHGQTEGQELSDAVWLKGWIDLTFRDKAKRAYAAFSQMHGMVRYPVSRARAAYWAGRAAEKMDRAQDADEWYAKAAAYPTTFYGQLAALKSYGHAPLRIPAEPRDEAAAAAFAGSDAGQAVAVAVRAGASDLASHLLTSFIEESESDEMAAAAARLGERIEIPYLGVRGAKKALQRNLILLSPGYPRPETPVDIPVERELALSIMRQESEFDARAKSPAGALGLMQLLPSTAKEVARKIGMGYGKGRLYERDYNMTLGSFYLSRLVDAYSGSYVMAIAAYNAGPGNVSHWSKQFGTPGDTVTGAVNWIELIPFAETRNYVQRVMENLQIYRHLEAGNEAPVLRLEEDLTR